MPKIIKPGNAVEEDRPVVINLPEVSLSDVKTAKSVDDDLHYFKNIDADTVLADDNDYEKYYHKVFSETDSEDEDYLKYYKKFTSFMEDDDDDFKKYYVPIYDDMEESEPDGGNGQNLSATETNDAKEAEQSFDDVKETDLTEEVPDIEEEKHSEDAHIIAGLNVKEAEQAKLEAQQVLQNAHDEANKIMEEARAEAESISMKLAAEVSEAEVKKKLAKTNAEAIIDTAKKEAETITVSAKEEADKNAQETREEAFAQGEKEGLEKGTETGHKVGYDKGYAEGLATGKSKGQNEGFQAVIKEMESKIIEATQKAQDILVKAREEKEQLLSSSDQQIVQIVMAIATKIIHKEISENPFNILQIVKEAIKKVSDQPHVFVTVNAMNYDFVVMACEELKKSMGSKQEISVVADNTLGPADVIVGTGGGGDVDARLETQMNEIRKTIEMVISQ